VIVRSTDPVACVPVHVPYHIVLVARRLARLPRVVALACRDWLVVRVADGVPCRACRRPAVVAFHDLPFTGDDDALAELCAVCIREGDAVTLRQLAAVISGD